MGWWEDMTKSRFGETKPVEESRIGQAIGIEEAPQNRPAFGESIVYPSSGEGFKDRLAAHRAKTQALAMRQRERIAQQAVAQREKQEIINKTEIEQKITKGPDGKIKKEAKIKSPNGATMQITQPDIDPDEVGEPGIFDKQYMNTLQQGVEPDPRLNLQPLAQLVDTWTGSRMAPGFQSAEAQAQGRLKQRIQYAGMLANQQKALEEAPLRRALLKAKTAKALTPKGSKKKKMDWLKYVTSLRNPENQISHDILQRGINQATNEELAQALKTANLKEVISPATLRMWGTSAPGDVQDKINRVFARRMETLLDAGEWGGDHEEAQRKSGHIKQLDQLDLEIKTLTDLLGGKNG
jgi:hypothetical protein